jgi:signal transduction histidine kinase
MKAGEGGSIALLCDSDGIVRSVARDDAGMAERVPSGSSIADLAGQGDQAKVRLFLETLRRERSAYGWEIDVTHEGIPVPMFFAGSEVGDGFLVVAARSQWSVGRAADEMMRINNEQANAIRSAAKALAARQAGREGGIYDELTKVNNELTNVQRELFKKNAELENLNNEKNRWLGMAAHDLRSPLGVILSYSTFLDEEAGPTLSEEHREFVTTIKEMSEFMLSLINDILDVSRIESGNLNLKLQLADLGEVVRRNVTRNRVLAEKKRIHMRLAVESSLPAVMVDTGKIEQVMNNLLSNAVKFSHAETEIQVRLQREGEEAVLTIADQGQGIPAEDLDKLFRPFSRTRVRSTGGESSTGLGLSIVRRIVEGHGGRVSVSSEIGKGSTFEVRLAFAETTPGDSAGPNTTL